MGTEIWTEDDLFNGDSYDNTEPQTVEGPRLCHLTGWLVVVGSVLLPWCLAGHWGSTGGLCRDDHFYHCQAQWLHVSGTSLWSTNIKVLKPFFYVFLQTEAWIFFVLGVFSEPPRSAIYLLLDSIWTDLEPSRTESLKKSIDAETRGKMGEDCLEAKNAMAWWNPGSEVWILYIVVWASWMNIDSYCEILHQWIGSASHYLQGFIHPKCRISSINSIWWCLSWGWSFWWWFWQISRRIGNSLHEHLNLTLCARVSSRKAMQYKNRWHLHDYVPMYCFYHCLWRPCVFSIRWNGAVPEIEAELQMRSWIRTKIWGFWSSGALNVPTRSVYKPVWMGAMTMITMEKEMKFWALP